MGMLANRIRENLRHLSRWAGRAGVSCFRVYERDIPEHPVTVDLHEGRAVAWAAHRRRYESPAARQTWLPRAADRGLQFDLVVCDPPTCSSSKRMQDVLDVGRRHPELINGGLRILAPGGSLFLSTNDRGFRLDKEALSPCRVEDLTADTLPEDYRGRQPHRCFRIEPLEGPHR